MSDVTVIGLGPMGVALAQSLLRDGHPVSVWNRRPDTTIFTSGTKSAYQKSKRLPKSLAGNVPYLGERVSTASSTDLAFLSTLFSSMMGFFHAARTFDSTAKLSQHLYGNGNCVRCQIR